MPDQKKPQAIFPDIPRTNEIIEKETGRMNQAWYLYFQQFNQAIQTNFKNEGLVIPQLEATDIAMLGSNYASVSNIVYDLTNNVFKGIVLVDPSTNPITTQTVTFTTHT